MGSLNGSVSYRWVHTVTILMSSVSFTPWILGVYLLDQRMIRPNISGVYDGNFTSWNYSLINVSSVQRCIRITQNYDAVKYVLTSVGGNKTSIAASTSFGALVYNSNSQVWVGSLRDPDIPSSTEAWHFGSSADEIHSLFQTENYTWIGTFSRRS